MKRILKGLAYGVGVVVLLIVIAVGALYALSGSRMSKTYTVTVQAPPLPTGAAALTEGKRLFTTRGCADCHGADLGGVLVVNNPAIGTLGGPNLTTGKGGVSGQRSDADLVRAIRHGVGQNGRALIFMPSTDFYQMSDADIAPLIAYIRSVPPVDKPSTVLKPGPVARMLFLAGKMPIFLPAELIDHTTKPSTVPVGITVEYGKYLATGCTGCHGFGFSGGPIPGAPPEWLPATNITPHATGIGKWSEADFSKAVREGRRPDGSIVRPPMPWNLFAQLTDTEVKALWLYLRTVPAKAYGGR